MSPNSKAILGSGSGKNISYTVVAKYGSPIILDATPHGEDKFIGWYKDGVRISNEYLDFGDGDSIEARFGTVVNINIVHIGNGANYGETSVSQERNVIAESNGRNSYSTEVIDGIPLQLDYLIDEDVVEFVGWKDADGNKLDLSTLAPIDGMTIYAEFEIKTIGITIIHKGAPIISEVTQDGLLLGDKSGKDVSYPILPNIDKGIYISHSSSNSDYEFVSITDEMGVSYGSVISASQLRAGMRLTITYKLSHIGVTIKHVGTSGGYTKASQNGLKIGDGNGGQGFEYSFNINPDKPLELYGEPQAQEGDMISVFVGFEYPNGQPVGTNDAFKDGDIIYAVFDIEIDHDFEWLFKVYWDEMSNTDIDTYAKLIGGSLNGMFVSYMSSEQDEDEIRRRRVSLDSNNLVELDIDNTRNGTHGISPEVITVLGKPCNKIAIRLETYSKEDGMVGMEDLKVEVYKKGTRFNEHVKDYFIPSSYMAHYKAAYEVCEVDLQTGELRDIERDMGSHNVRE